MTNQHHRVAIIGAGFGGLATAIRLKQSGSDDFVILERESGIGGTWHANTYPGAQCDIPSALYSFSFAPNPQWSRLYPLQVEIKDYLQDCARRFGILDRIRFNEDVVDAQWDDEAQLWRITTASGYECTAATLVAATGPFSQPSVPDIDGMADFGGTVLHSARWDHSVDLAGKRVAVIGTGASAVQLIPQIQPVVDELVVFQRTATWIMPHPDRPVGARMQRAFERWPVLLRALRASVNAVQEMMVPGLIYRPALLKGAEAVGRWHLRRQVADPVLRDKLTPHYTFGCKRPTFSNTYFPALAAPNSTVETEPIERITASGIQTRDGRQHEVDVIILATGFNITGNDGFKRIRGRHGLTLTQTWENNGMSAHLGTTVAGFPNFYVILGPNSAIYTSQVVTIEAQVDYIMAALELMDRRNLASLEVRADVQQGFIDKTDRILAGSTWNSGGCASYYLGPDGRNITFWPGFARSFQTRMRHLREGDFVGQEADSPADVAVTG